MKLSYSALLLGAASAFGQDALVMNDEPFIQGPDVNGCYSDTDLIKMSEGYRACEYKDSVGIKTICYGYNLERSCAKAAIAHVGGDYNAVMAGGCLSQSQCNSLLETEIVSARNGEAKIFGSSVSCSCAKAVLVDMTYNLGEAGLASFGTFDSLVKQGKWAAAAADGKGTKWCHQTGSRCTRDMAQLEKC